MNQNESNEDRIEDTRKAEHMAYAEAPARDEKLKLIADKKEGFKNRLDEIKAIAHDDDRDVDEIQPNEDEKYYAKGVSVSGLDRLDSRFVPPSNELPTDPRTTAKIAKALVEQSNIRSHRTLTAKNPSMKHPREATIDALASRYEERINADPDGAPNQGRYLHRIGQEFHDDIEKVFNEKLIDPSRSVTSDKASEDTAEKYDVRQQIKQSIKEDLDHTAQETEL